MGKKLFLTFVLIITLPLCAQVSVGADVLFESGRSILKNKRIGIITNQSAINRDLKTTFELFQAHKNEYTIVCVFSPEHGFYGNSYADEGVEDLIIDGVPVYTLFGARRRPDQQMLANLDLLIFDLQDIGSRSYTYVSTLFYCMEEAAKANLPLFVLDRPNPMGGLVVDGPPLEERWRSFLGYINVPYCHGMTIGELARFFNEEYHVNCSLTVVPMKGWKRTMSFSETGLPWVSPSPQIPEPDTPFFYPATGLIGHCSMVSIGIGYTLPFKLIGAPWIDASRFAAALNAQKLSGVYFQPIYYRPFYGKFKTENCQGVRIMITNAMQFQPVTTQFTIMGVIKNLYPSHYEETIEALLKNVSKLDVFHKLMGSEEILSILKNEKYIIWKLRDICHKTRAEFLPIRKKYLLSDYN